MARAFSRETEALWTAFRLTPEEKERVWLAAYDAPWHGQASSPYRCDSGLIEATVRLSTQEVP